MRTSRNRKLSLPEQRGVAAQTEVARPCRANTNEARNGAAWPREGASALFTPDEKALLLAAARLLVERLSDAPPAPAQEEVGCCPHCGLPYDNDTRLAGVCPACGWVVCV
jgi:hypothetical protein